MFHVSLIILMISHVSSICFSSKRYICVEVIIIIIDVGALIFSHQKIDIISFRTRENIPYLIYPVRAFESISPKFL